MDLRNHEGKVTVDKKIFFNLYQVHKSENRGYCSHYSEIFNTTTLGKWGLTHLPGDDKKLTSGTVLVLK